MRLGSDEAKGLGLRRGDLLIIDTAIKARIGDLVVASINGHWRPRRLQRMSGQNTPSQRISQASKTRADITAPNAKPMRTGLETTCSHHSLSVFFLRRDKGTGMTDLAGFSACNRVSIGPSPHLNRV